MVCRVVCGACCMLRRLQTLTSLLSVLALLGDFAEAPVDHANVDMVCETLLLKPARENVPSTVEANAC